MATDPDWLIWTREPQALAQTGLAFTANPYDRERHPAAVFSCCKLLYICDVIGGAPATSFEASEIGWFAEADVPRDLSLGRVLPSQIARMFEHQRNPGLSSDFE